MKQSLNLQRDSQELLKNSPIHGSDGECGVEERIADAADEVGLAGRVSTLLKEDRSRTVFKRGESGEVPGLHGP